jgi:DNA-binding CsgD family transcriptional regulator
MTDQDISFLRQVIAQVSTANTIKKPLEFIDETKPQDTTSLALQTCLSKNGADCAIALLNVQSFEKLHELMVEHITALGFTDYAILKAVTYVSHGITDILTTLPDEYIKEYQTTWRGNPDPCVEYAANNTAPVLYSDIKGALNALPFTLSDLYKVEEVLALYKPYDINDVLLIPMAVTTKGNTNVMLVMKRGLNSEAMRHFAEKHVPQLQVMASIIASSLSKRFQRVPFRCKTTTKPLINPRPLKMLATLANNDYVIFQAAESLHISVVTANKHLETVRKLLGVRTNYAAIKKAVQEGYIEYD